MSLVTDSPVNSSSSDDFAAFLDAELEANSAESSLNEEAEDDNYKDEEAGDAEPEDEEARDEEAENEEAVGDNDLNGKRIKRYKVEKLESIHEQGSTSYATLEQQTEESTKLDRCTHPGFFEEMCIYCGQRSDEASGVTFGYIHKGLRLGNDEIVRLRNADVKNLLRHRRLYLVLDLDHTLLNSILLAHLTPDEDYLKSQADSLQDVSKGSLFMLTFMHMMTKLRPFVRTFLKEASQMFEMYIYTMGDRPYALEMAKLLDPTGEYFSAKVISRDDGTQRHQKGLDVVLGQESAVLILDDTENAWVKHKDNLILMERYHFFASSCYQFGYNCKSLSQLKSDESEPDGALAAVLKVLKRVHNIFFDEPGDDAAGKDVRQALKTVRKQILKDCKIVFSRVFPTKFPAESHHLWKMAEQLGAKCLTEHDSSVTHVVSTDVGTEKSRWAVKENKFLVHPQWIEAANFLWQKQPEENFPVKLPKGE
ncbi:RNA polymerase II C-terminal domain phosphatase-like 4 isoform X2 [Mangifera indica]|uniref:RNA polymerase II C-terminal domain phosphatase-like 4 isoform X2 n=1 Tax=Mangifera indica TaxID=29780 RepID=UPI001CF939EE|nr:RNA polymerase II C-terminal domain phosphatase-like 4 isoform X2 [Mangifera indica]